MNRTFLEQEFSRGLTSVLGVLHKQAAMDTSESKTMPALKSKLDSAGAMRVLDALALKKKTPGLFRKGESNMDYRKRQLQHVAAGYPMGANS